jgi:AmmeMemoRadiSam system protein A
LLALASAHSVRTLVGENDNTGACMATMQTDAGGPRRAEPSPPATEVEAATFDRLGSALLAIARGSIAEGVGRRGPARPDVHDPRLQAAAATFVTLRRASTGRIHGCMGSLTPTRTLAADVRANAMAAAFLDRRSPPLTAADYDDLSVEVSLLGGMETLPTADERQATAGLRRGHGYILTWGPMHGVLLPQMWDECEGPGPFLRALRIKAGLPADFWAQGLRLHGFHVTSWRDGARENPRKAGAAH